MCYGCALGNHWKIDTVSTFKSFSLEFDLDTEFEETTGDGRKLKVFSAFGPVEAFTCVSVYFRASSR